MRLVRLRAPGGELEAAFAPEAGLVGSSLTHRGEELLSQRRSLEEYARSGSTFGIPFLHPWANRLADYSYAVAGQEVDLDRDSGLLRIEEHDLPIHGLAPYGLQWEVEENGGDALRAQAEFDRDRLTGLPLPHKLAVEVALDDDGADDPHDADRDGRGAGPGRLRLPPVPRAARRAAPGVGGRAARRQPAAARREPDPDRGGGAARLPPRRARGPLARRRLHDARRSRARSPSPAAAARSASSSSRATRTRRSSRPRART